MSLTAPNEPCPVCESHDLRVRPPTHFLHGYIYCLRCGYSEYGLMEILPGTREYEIRHRRAWWAVQEKGGRQSSIDDFGGVA